MRLTWDNIFNTNHKHFGHIDGAWKAAQESGYPYFCWNGRVYESHLARDTGFCVPQTEHSVGVR